MLWRRITIFATAGLVACTMMTFTSMKGLMITEELARSTSLKTVKKTMHLEDNHDNDYNRAQIVALEAGNVTARDELRDDMLSSPPPLPTFNKTGVVVFNHLPKTGGTTVRKLSKRAHLVRITWPHELETLTETIATVLAQNEKIVFIELHGTIPGLPKLHTYMEQWKEEAKRHHAPFFSFLLLREPVSFHLSYFQFFHRPGCHKDWCERNVYTLTEDNLLASAVPNKQCEILMHGQIEDKKRAKPFPAVSAKDCSETVPYYLEKDWDWVGYTEELRSVGLPGLAKLILNDESVGSEMPSRNERKSGLTVKTLKKETVMTLLHRSRYDVELYDRVQTMNFVKLVE